MRLPPLNAIRAFESAARLGGFARSAQELNVTPAAVSHQVKLLEEHLGLQLFNRLPRGLEITSAGQELLPDVAKGFAHLARAVGAVSGGQLAGRLTVSAAPSFATLWLTPRLGAFTDAYPDIQLRLLASDSAPNLDLGRVDVRLPYGIGNFPGLKAKLLMPETIFPVCSPSLLNQKPLRRFSDLSEHTLLHDIDTGTDEPTMTWARWLRDAGLEPGPSLRHIEFSNSILLTEAAVQGQGVALGRMTLVRSHLETGRLVRPFKVSRPGDYAHYFVTTEAGAERPRVKVFLDWLEREVRNDSFE